MFDEIKFVFFDIEGAYESMMCLVSKGLRAVHISHVLDMNI